MNSIIYNQIREFVIEQIIYDGMYCKAHHDLLAAVTPLQLIFSFWSFTHVCFHDSIYENYTVICVNFYEGNDCCVVLKSGTEFYAFTDLPNTFHHLLWLLM